MTERAMASRAADVPGSNDRMRMKHDEAAGNTLLAARAAAIIMMRIGMLGLRRLFTAPARCGRR